MLDDKTAKAQKEQIDKILSFVKSDLEDRLHGKNIDKIVATVDIAPANKIPHIKLNVDIELHGRMAALMESYIDFSKVLGHTPSKGIEMLILSSLVPDALLEEWKNEEKK